MASKQLDTLRIDNIKLLKVISDPIRKQIIDVLYDEPLSASQIADEINFPKDKIYYHIKKLQSAGILIIAESEKVKGITQNKFINSAKKFEIDDSQSQIVDDVYRRWRRYKPLGESKSGKTRVEYYKDLMPDQLSKHYPQTEGTVVGRLPDMGGMYVPTDRGVRGSGKIGIGFPTSYFRRQAEVSDPYTGEIQYPKGTLGTPELDKPFVRRGMLHERQHQIQDIEDFGGGSNERFWQPEGQMPVKAPIGKEREEALKIFEDYGGYKKLHREYKKDGAEAEFFEKYGDRIVELEKKMDTIRSKHFPLGKYHHSSGEVEARNVERRSLLSPQERIETPPWETIDVGRGVGASGAKLEHLGDDPYLLPFTKTDKEVREMVHVITPSEFRRITREWMANRNK